VPNNLAVVGHRHFYDYSLLDEHLDNWMAKNGHIDLIICGGSSGADYLAERWADNNAVPILVFHEEWSAPRTGLIDDGRTEAAITLTQKIVQAATHLIAFVGSDSKWTLKTVELAKNKGIEVKVHKVAID